jgi:hypothetical protein
VLLFGIRPIYTKSVGNRDKLNGHVSQDLSDRSAGHATQQARKRRPQRAFFCSEIATRNPDSSDIVKMLQKNITIMARSGQQIPEKHSINNNKL